MLNKRADKLELLRIAEAVALEKSIDKELIITSMESGIAKAAKSKFGQDNEIKVLINRENGDIELSAANITLKATEEIKLINPAGIVDIQSATFNIKTTTCNILSRHQLTMAGQFVDMAGATSLNMDTMDTKDRARFAGSIMTVLNNKILEFFRDL